MRQLHQFTNLLKFAATSKVVIASIAFVLLAIFTTASFAAQPNQVSAANCDKNDVMPCGYSTPSNFISKAKSQKLGDLYAKFGLSTADYDRFIKTAKKGTVYKNGDVKLSDGTLVGKNAKSVGRQKLGSNDTKFSAGGSTFYERSTQTSFASNSLPAYVLMNGNRVEFIALTACGNPVAVTPTGNAPAYSCKALKSRSISRTQFAFSTDASATNGAKITKVVYDFGDGQKKEMTNPSTEVTHTYATPKEYTVRVTVYVSVNGETKLVTSTGCAKKIEVKPEVKTASVICKDLTVATISRTRYTFTATKTVENATFKKFIFVITDASGKEITRKDSTSGVLTYDQTTAGSFAVQASVVATVNGQDKTVTSTSCKKSFTITQDSSAICNSLTPALVKDNTYRFTVNASTTGNAKLDAADFTFGDGQAAKGIKPSATNKVTADHTYTKDGNYTITATLHFTGVTSTGITCQAKLTIKPDVCAHNPQLPKDSPDCKPPVEECKPGIPVGSKDCETTPPKQECKPGVEVGSKGCDTIPETGPAEVAGGVLGLSGLVTAGGYYIRSRRDLMGTIFKL